MRIVSYNILDGGEGRADPLAEVIAAQRADIVALVEADNVDVLERIAGRLEMDYIRAEGTGPHAVALLSRWMIVQSINHAVIRGGLPCLLEATVRRPTGEEWIVGVTHLHPRAFEADEAVREKEVSALLEVFAPHRAAGRAHLLAGDFNANSPIQKIDPQRCKPKTRDAWEANGGQIPRRAVQMILDAGYVDCLDAASGETAARAGSFTTQYPGQRIDYVFGFGIERNRINASWIEQDRLAKYASDHYPVGVEIE
jgi:endonuclease/exonuclease/phosphatase family metal-dependent hydrolase